MVLCQRRGEQSYEDRLEALNLTSLVSRKTYLSVSFACSCLINASVFHFCRWCVNSRHDDLTFKQTVTAKTNQFKHCLWVQFPSIWSKIPSSVRNSLILSSKSVFKSNLKSYFADLNEWFICCHLLFFVLFWFWLMRVCFCYILCRGLLSWGHCTSWWQYSCVLSVLPGCSVGLNFMSCLDFVVFANWIK